MNSSQKIDRATSIIKGDAVLRGLISESPQAVVMPFAEERDKRYLMVGLFLKDETLTKEALAAVCRRVVEVLGSDGVLDDLNGLEIMPCALRQGRTARMFRLSILSEALERAKRFSAADIALPNPAEGISCILYERNLP